MQVDPIRYAARNNLYAYVENDPLNLVDPLGAAPDSPQSGDQSVGNSLASSIALPGIAGDLAGAGEVATAPLAALAAAILLATTTSTADRTQDEVQYVVRGGAGAAISFERGTNLTSNGYGFSVQTAPSVSIDELARGGYFPQAQISISTVQELQAIPGVIVNYPTPGRGDYHGTVNVPNPPSTGFFDAVSGVFVQQPNPYPVPR